MQRLQYEKEVHEGKEEMSCERQAKHDTICNRCVEVCGAQHDVLSQDWSQWELKSCPLWGKEKAVHMYSRKRRHHPVVQTRHHIPKRCLYPAEHVVNDVA